MLFEEFFPLDLFAIDLLLLLRLVIFLGCILGESVLSAWLSERLQASIALQPYFQIYQLANDIQVYTIMKQANFTIDTTLKNLLHTASQDFAWQILQLQISLQCSPQPQLQSLMRLIQLYMLGVQVLENEDDPRFTYFNNKIHSIMMRKSVVQQLHRIATGSTPDPQTLNKVHKMQMDNRKNQYELQLTLQKDMYTLNSVKDIINKTQKHTIRKNQHIQNHLEGQNQVLEDRIKNRKLRSLSKGRQIQVDRSPIVSKASYGTYSRGEGQQRQVPPQSSKKK